jgi:hypothetical protein
MGTGLATAAGATWGWITTGSVVKEVAGWRASSPETSWVVPSSARRGAGVVFDPAGRRPEGVGLNLAIKLLAGCNILER